MKFQKAAAAACNAMMTIVAIILTASTRATTAWQLKETNIPKKTISTRYFVLSDLNITSVSPDAFKILANYSLVGNIVISKNLFTNITTVMFNATELSQVRTLKLDRNKINTIEDFSFFSLKNLSTLDLYRNLLTKINRNTFAGLVKLMYLDLTENRIAFIEPLAFVYFSETIQRIYLHNNYLQEFDLYSLQNKRNSTLEWLNLAGNKIGEGLAKGLKLDFRGSRLNSLFLDNNKLTRIPADVFRPLANLKYFSLGYNNLRLDGKQLRFDYLTKVNKFILTGNNCTRIGADLFKGMTNLRELDLSENGDGQPVFVHESIFDMNLEYLNLCWMKYANIVDQSCEKKNYFFMRTSTRASTATTSTTKKTIATEDLSFYFDY
jgi:Leucine-rich repeat (LRR) protein